MKSKFSSPKQVFLLILLLTACIGPLSDAKSKNDFYSEVSRLNKVFSEINRKYVEEVDPTEMSKAAIDGVRNILDPHTAVFDPKDYGDLKIATEGEFGGLGITISIRDKVLTIITPLHGTPAFNMGLQAGDRIVKIEGESTKGITADEAVGKLRGKVGTDVTITISREGEPQFIDYTITRGRIILHPVPYYGMLTNEIGYIKNTQFSQKTTTDMKKAFKELKNKGMKKLIFDLRFNPGGLLNQAISVSEMFLKKGNEIVSTKGRTQNSESKSKKDGIIPQDMPVVVLINEGSASAAEIVSGALQDWDRAVIMGKTSFGKGSVQTIFPLTNQGHALKLTTAFYYLPMGRCINKPENDIKSHHTDKSSEDSLATDSSAIDSSEIYYTNNKRKMYGGGGITPDIEVDQKSISWYAQILERQTKFFKYAIKVRSDLKEKKIIVKQDWEVPENIVDDFKEYLSNDTSFSNQETAAEQTLSMLDTILIKEQELSGDTSKTLKNTELKSAIDNLKIALQKDKKTQFDTNKEYIKRAIKRELLTAESGEKARIRFTLNYDNQVQEAIKVINDTEKYKNILEKSSKK